MKTRGKKKNHRTQPYVLDVLLARIML